MKLTEIFSRKGAISLVTLLLILSAQSAVRAHSEDNFDHYTDSPHLKQEADQFEGVIVNKTVFSATENYNRFNAFIIGFKLADDYLFVDECLNEVIDTVDNVATYQNVLRYHLADMAEGTETTYYKPYLFVTEVIANHLAESLDNCYQFARSIAQKETDRFNTFGKNWGDFFLAFLFNQMGNALNFQAKFESIQDLRESQNFVGVYQEYGDLFYLIWNFQPIVEASLDQADNFIETWFEEHQWLVEENVSINVEVLKGIVQHGAKIIHSFGESVGQTVDNLVEEIASQAEARRQKREAERPMVGQVIDNSFNAQKAGELGNGIFVGLVDVFAYDSHPRSCQTSFTTGSTAFGHLFLGTVTYVWSDTTSQENLISDIAYILKFPYGVSYHCVNAAYDILVSEPYPENPDDWSEEQRLEQMITLQNEYVTNLTFNLGYIYQDIAAIVALSFADDAKYWNLLGVYLGDIIIRFFWRKRFTRNFDYGGALAS